MDNTSETTEDKEKLLFVSVSTESPMTDEELDNITKSIDLVTPDDVGVLLSTDEIEYLNADQLESYVSDLVDAMEKL